MTRHGYAYSVIQYTHDAFSGESLNVGIVARSSDGRFEFRIPSSFVRVKHAFPNSSVSTLRRLLELGLERLKESVKETDDLKLSLERVFTPDDGALKFSKLGAGVTVDFNSAVNDLLNRFVLRCELDFNFSDLSENKKDHVVWQAERRVQYEPSNDDSYGVAEFQKLHVWQLQA